MKAADRKDYQAEERNQVMRPAAIGAVLLAVAVVVATAIMLLTSRQPNSAPKPEETVLENPKVTVIPARPSVEPTADPIINSMKLYAFGGEITTEVGFTAYVGDKITLSVALEPRYTHPPIYWSLSDSDAARLSVSDDRLSCEFTVLKSAGKCELTVKCYSVENVFPVYLWGK